MTNWLQFNPTECEQIAESYRSAIQEKYGRLHTFLDSDLFYSWDNSLRNRNETPREDALTTVFPCASFWYLNYLVALQPSEIIDLGCGANFFKNIIPNVIGIDPNPNNPHCDVIGTYNAEYVKKHKNRYQAIFSIDALHFRPIVEFTDLVHNFYSLIKLGGRGYLSLNSARFDCPKGFDRESYIKEQIETQLTDIDFLITDVLISHKEDEFMDGNIRLVMQK